MGHFLIDGMFLEGKADPKCLINGWTLRVLIGSMVINGEYLTHDEII